MTDDAIAQRQPEPPSSPAPLAVLSLSAPVDSQPDFDENAALVHAASAEDSSIEEVVLLRLLVFRRAHPDAIMRTRLERFDDGQIAIQAEITLRSGATASAHAVADGGVAGIEQAEHRALGRALEFLGEVVLVSIATPGETEETDAGAVDEISASSETLPTPRDDAPVGVALDLDVWDDEDAFDADDAPPSREGDLEQEPFEDVDPRTQPRREIPPPRFSSPAPRERPGAVARDRRPQREMQGPPADENPEVAPPPAVVDAVRRANLRRQGAGQGERRRDEPAEAQHESFVASSHGPESMNDDAPLENYSWTAFWRVARPQGLDKIKVEQIIGEPITPLTPLQVREKLKAAGYDL